MMIQGTSRCPHGHDMTLPKAWTQINAAGTNGQCRVCRCIWQRARGTRYTTCRECGKEHPPSSSTFCSSKCQAIGAARDRAQATKVRHAKQDNTLAILTLVDQRERAATHWERAEINARLEALRA